MRAYGNAERYAARALDGFPSLRRSAKYAYQRFNYALHRQRGFTFSIDPLASIMTQAAWAGIQDARDIGDHEFSGYYDVSPWSTDMRYCLAHRWSGGDTCAVVVYDRLNAAAHVLGHTRAWNLQQGARAQWLPQRDKPVVIFNDVVDRHLVTRITPLGGAERICPFPVQSVAPDAQTAISLNYRRLASLRPEYGYDVDVDYFTGDRDVLDDGLWLVDLATGERRLIIRLSELIDHAPRPEMEGSDHKVNHVLHSPNGNRFVFMHRWIGSHGKFSRLFLAGARGENLRLLLDTRMVSHYSWRDDQHLIVWARADRGDRYYLLDVDTGMLKVIGHGVLDRYGDGHPSYSPDRRWMLTDSYPDRARQRHLLLYDTLNATLIQVGRVLAPWRFDGPARCDLHPRWSPDGAWVSIDSAHEGVRRSYCIDVRAIVQRHDQ